MTFVLRDDKKMTGGSKKDIEESNDGGRLGDARLFLTRGAKNARGLENDRRVEQYQKSLEMTGGSKDASKIE
jgi:hypothetical protein